MYPTLERQYSDERGCLGCSNVQAEGRQSPLPLVVGQVQSLVAALAWLGGPGKVSVGSE